MACPLYLAEQIFSKRYFYEEQGGSNGCQNLIFLTPPDTQIYTRQGGREGGRGLTASSSEEERIRIMSLLCYNSILVVVL